VSRPTSRTSRSPTLESDRRFLAQKLAIADFAVTQFFFEVGEWVRLVDELGEIGWKNRSFPHHAGDDPARHRSYGQMGAPVPPALVDRLEAADRRGGPTAVRGEGIAAARELCEGLLNGHGRAFISTRSTARRRRVRSITPCSHRPLTRRGGTYGPRVTARIAVRWTAWLKKSRQAPMAYSMFPTTRSFFHRRDGIGIDIWPAAKLVLDAAAKKYDKTIEWKEVLAAEGFDETGDCCPSRR